LPIRAAGCRREDKEKLFLPYFSTKGRGTGLGLAIVNRILTDHNAATIRVEDNVPSGARFTVEIIWRRSGVGSGARGNGDGGNERMKPGHILVVDDEPGIRQSLSGVLEDEGYPAFAVGSGEACVGGAGAATLRLVLLDVWLPGMDGMDTLARIQEIPFAERPVVVMISGHGTIETAVKATKLGAFDFLEKPLTIDKVTVVVKNACRTASWRLENSRLKEDAARRYRIIGESVPMKALRQQLALMAGTNGRVLIYGESGTGKELVAHAIHAMSPRAAEPFVEVNCAAIPEELIESELFGHARAAFRARRRTRPASSRRPTAARCFWTKWAT
jgi:DNA-binding NtrC family response regulator